MTGFLFLVAVNGHEICLSVLRKVVKSGKWENCGPLLTLAVCKRNKFETNVLILIN